jgi:hypothetical protein
LARVLSAMRKRAGDRPSWRRPPSSCAPSCRPSWARLDVERRDVEVDADRLQIVNAEYDFHVYCNGGMTLEALIDRVAGPLVAGHLMRRHPLLPSMESALQQLRDDKTSP